MKAIIILLLMLALAGCETTKSFLGISTKNVEASRVNAVSKIFNLDYRACFEKAEAALKEIGCYIYEKKTDMIACYRSPSDTTVVGIFFKEIDSVNIEVQVSSPSSVVRDEIADKLFLKIGQ